MPAPASGPSSDPADLARVRPAGSSFEPRPGGADASAQAGAGGRGEQALVETIMAASQVLVAIAARSLAETSDVDVTLPQFRALVVLTVRGAQRPSDLGVELAVEPSTATRMCDRLVRKGLIAREHSTVDRRAVQVDLTDSGRVLVATVMARRRREMEGLVAAVPTDHHPAVITALQALVDAAGAAPDRDWALREN